jgi:hypothetical protein
MDKLLVLHGIMGYQPPFFNIFHDLHGISRYFEVWRSSIFQDGSSKKWFLFSEVLEEVQREMVNYKGCGMSVMEMSHRSKEFMAIAAEAEKNLRDIFGVPSNEASAGIHSGNLTWLLKMAFYSGFSH